MNPAYTLIYCFIRTHLNKLPPLTKFSKWPLTFNIHTKYIHKFRSCLTLYTMSITATDQLRLFTVRITLSTQIHSAGKMWNILGLQKMAHTVTTRFQTVINMLDVRVSVEFIWIEGCGRLTWTCTEPSGFTPGGNFFPICMIISLYKTPLLHGIMWYEWHLGK